MRVKLYLARCAPTARHGVISTIWLDGDLARTFTGSVRIGGGIDLCTVNSIEIANFLHGTADCSSDEFALLVGFAGCELVSERYESGDFAFGGVVKNPGISNLWGFFGFW